MRTILLYCAALVALLAVILMDRPAKKGGDWKVQATTFFPDKQKAEFFAADLVEFWDSVAITISQEGR